MQEPDFVTPDQAETLLLPEVERLQAEGWKVTRWAQYLVRLKKDDQVLDVAVDLTGVITHEQSRAVTTAHEIARLITIMVFIAFLLVVFVFAITVGWI